MAGAKRLCSPTTICCEPYSLTVSVKVFSSLLSSHGGFSINKDLPAFITSVAIRKCECGLAATKTPEIVSSSRMSCKEVVPLTPLYF